MGQLKAVAVTEAAMSKYHPFQFSPYELVLTKDDGTILDEGEEAIPLMRSSETDARVLTREGYLRMHPIASSANYDDCT
jgi:hypothetical protein